MVTEEQAVGIAQAHVRAMSEDFGGELVLLKNETITRDFGWVFFYDSKSHVESGDFRYTLAGNAPFIVAKDDGAVHVTGTAHPVEFYIKNFERCGSPVGAEDDLAAYFCPVCGYEMYEPPWLGESPSDEICPCCGIQFGYTDCAGGKAETRDDVYESWRKKWIENGMKWCGGTGKPSGWNPVEQMRRAKSTTRQQDSG